MKLFKLSLIALSLLFITITVKSQDVNLAKNASITVSSLYNGVTYPASNINDSIISDASRWLSAAEDTSWIKFGFSSIHQIAGLHFYSGYQDADPVAAFYVEFYSAGVWNDIPSAHIVTNEYLGVSVKFDAAVDVITDSLRIIITQTPGDIARVREVTIWEKGVDDMPKLGTGVDGYTYELTDEDIPKIYINQSGYNIDKPKRFTAPLTADGTSFQIRNLNNNSIVYSGTISDSLGDFSDFNPLDNAEFQIETSTDTSFAFRIGHWWLERATYQNAVDFMIDSRHYVGNYTAPCTGSFGWRDDHHFGWELHTLVPQYLSHPDAYKNMTSRVSYQAPSDISLWGNLDAYNEAAPDIVKLIHWGADIIVTQGLTHEHMKAQLAYFLYAWPYIKEWLPQQNYDVVSAYVYANWTTSTADHSYPYDRSPEHNLLALKTLMGTTKGELPPGSSVQPNLLMYEVAKRENRSDSMDYFNAAYNQVEWMIANLDWEDPITTKGQRMSEFMTLTGLSHFATQYEADAPAGLKAKIEEWTAVMIRRSDNMWDFRKLTDTAEWVPYIEGVSTAWNEPGNVVGLPACLMASMTVVDTDTTLERLNEIAYAHMDNCFGRNPCGRHFSYDGPGEIEGVDIGWYSFYAGGIGQLANVRFVLDGSPKYNHYPYHPEIGNVGWTEGWVQFNVAYNLSLAYMAYNDIELEIIPSGSDYTVRMKAPFNFKYSEVESIDVDISTTSGSKSTLTLTETSANSAYFEATFTPTETVKVSYGYGYLSHEKTITIGANTFPVNFQISDGTGAIEGATVTLSGYISQTTNSTGDATIANVSPGTDIAYTVSATGYNTENGTVTVVDAEITENVTLSKLTYALSVINGSGSGNYESGESIQIIANVKVDSVFTLWTGDTDSIADVSNDTSSIIMPASNISISANYQEIQELYNLIFNVSDGQNQLGNAVVSVDGLSPLATSNMGIATFNDLEPGSYNYNVSLSNYSSENGTVIIGTESVSKDIILSIIESVGDQSKSAFNIFPNPTKNILNIHTNRSIKTVIITDIDGKTVENISISKTKTSINTNRLHSGMYLLQVYDENHTLIGSRKLIKE